LRLVSTSGLPTSILPQTSLFPGPSLTVRTIDEILYFKALTNLVEKLSAWIFQIAGTLTTASAVKVTLAGGALPQNIVWVVSGAVALGSTSVVNGIILGATSITLNTGATVNGRLLAQTAVNLGKATVNAPSGLLSGLGL
jgi:hypothetical protein